MTAKKKLTGLALHQAYDDAKEVFQVTNQEHSSISSSLTERRQELARKHAEELEEFNNNNSELIEEEKTLLNAKNQAKERLRKLAEKMYLEENPSGKKKLDSDITIRAPKTYDYKEEEAVHYAVVYGLLHCLRINKTTFKKVLNTFNDPKEVGVESLEVTHPVSLVLSKGFQATSTPEKVEGKKEKPVEGKPKPQPEFKKKKLKLDGTDEEIPF